MLDAGIWVEVTTLLIEGQNDSNEDLKGMADFIVHDLGKSVPWHLSAFSPNYKMLDHQVTQVSTLQRAKQIGEKAGLEHIYLGNVPVNIHTCCPECQTTLVDRSGYNITSMMEQEGVCHNCSKKITGVWR